MDNRFNFKDFVMIVLVLGIGLLVFASMVQKGRQWDVLQQTLAEMKNQRESVDLYKRELAQMKRDQEALRGGVERLIETLQQSSAEGQGPRLAEDASVDLGGRDYSNDKTFLRVADLRDRPDFAEGDYFIDAFATTVKSLTPYIAGDIYASRIADYVLDSLLTIDPMTLELLPGVAKSWEVSDDGLTITYQMRSDVVFADGVPMTAEDVVFTYDWVMNPKVAASRMRTYFEKFESVEALDKYTVQFKYRESYFQALTVTGLYLQILPKHFVTQFSIEEYNKMPGLLFGSGPYKLAIDPKQWQPGSQKIELVRNENYWGPRPPLDKVIWREITEDTARLAELRDEKIDRFGVPPSMYRTLSADEDLREKCRLFEYDYVSRGYFYIGWNQRRNDRATPFADKRVRQAMTLLIDREGICGRVYDNLATPATGPFHPLGWQADPEIKAWPYDPQRARALLEEAGYIDRDGNGVRESVNGVPLSFEFIYSANSPESEQVGLLMKEAMRQAGVRVQLEPMDWPVMQQRLNDRNFDSIMLGWGGAVDTDVFQMFHSSQIDDGGDNTIHYVNPELDKLVEQARATVDREKGKVLWREVHRILHEDQPYTFMTNPKTVVFYHNRLRNLQVTKIGMNYATEYFVPGPMQLHKSE